MRILKIKNLDKFQEPLILFVCILFLLLVSHDFFFRLDLTSDKRYSLDKNTKSFLRDLKEEVEVEVYLEGDLPINFKKFRNSIEEKLIEFRNESKFIKFKFTNVQKLSIKERKRLFKSLKKEKIYATNIFIRDRGKRIEKIVFPIAKISSKDKETYIKLFKVQGNTPTEILIHKAIEGLEYNLISSISDTILINQKKIAILIGCGQPPKKKLSMISKAIRKSYILDFVDIDKDINSYDALIMIKPSIPFSDTSKYLLDQYIMNGGKILFFINSVNINMKNLYKGLDFAFPNNINLSDMLFKYGVRINQDLIEDLNSSYYPIVVGGDNKNLKMQWLRWPFFPIIDNFGNHIITKKISSVSTRFVSSIDIIKNTDINKIPLLLTSKHSRRNFSPIKIDLNDLRKDLNPNEYNQGPFKIAYLLEGHFTSFFVNKFLPEGFNKERFKEKSKLTSLLIVSSGNMIVNEVDPKTKSPIDLGYDFYYNHTFSQQEFVLNVLDYMLNKNSLIFSKNKDIKLRLLNLAKIKDHYLRWQLINIFVPIFILLIWALIWNYFYRKRNINLYTASN